MLQVLGSKIKSIPWNIFENDKKLICWITLRVLQDCEILICFLPFFPELSLIQSSFEYKELANDRMQRCVHRLLLSKMQILQELLLLCLVWKNFHQKRPRWSQSKKVSSFPKKEAKRWGPLRQPVPQFCQVRKLKRQHGAITLRSVLHVIVPILYQKKWIFCAALSFWNMPQPQIQEPADKKTCWELGCTVLSLILP